MKEEKQEPEAEKGVKNEINAFKEVLEQMYDLFDDRENLTDEELTEKLNIVRNQINAHATDIPFSKWVQSAQLEIARALNLYGVHRVALFIDYMNDMYKAMHGLAAMHEHFDREERGIAHPTKDDDDDNSTKIIYVKQARQSEAEADPGIPESRFGKPKEGEA